MASPDPHLGESVEEGIGEQLGSDPGEPVTGGMNARVSVEPEDYAGVNELGAAHYGEEIATYPAPMTMELLLFLLLHVVSLDRLRPE